MSLPTEIWRYIFMHLQPRDPDKLWNIYESMATERRSAQDLCSVCLVSKDLCSIAQPLLYASVKPALHGEFKLLQTLAVNPMLASYVRTLDTSDQAALVPGALDLIHAATRSLQLPPRFKDCLQDTVSQEGCADMDLAIRNPIRPPAHRFLHNALMTPLGTLYGGYATLVLALARRVQRVSIDMVDWGDSLFWLIGGSRELEEECTYPERGLDQMWLPGPEYHEADRVEVPSSIATAAEPSPQEIANHGIKAFANYGLPWLKELYIQATMGADSGSLSIAQLEPVLHHPSLEVLRIDHIDYRKDQIDRMKWPDKKTSIHTLELYMVLVDGDSLRDIFKRCPKLESLAIEVGDSSTENFNGDFASWTIWHLDLVDIGNALRIHGQNLKELRFGSRRYRHDGRFEDDRESTRGIGSLRELQCLKKLSINAINMAVHTPPIFPDGAVAIHDAEATIEKFKETLMEATIHLLPSSLEEYDIDGDSWSELSNYCEAVDSGRLDVRVLRMKWPNRGFHFDRVRGEEKCRRRPGWRSFIRTVWNFHVPHVEEHGEKELVMIKDS